MINVNMTPNPYDIQTLHCSQGDDGREFEIKLHNNGEVLDTSSVKEPIVYPVYKGGTEEILPVNGSVPVTSPLKAEIQYPDGVRDVEFTYQQTPTTEDGQAKIKSIKGNTINWNQLIQNGNFADTSVWQNYGSSFTVSNGVASIKSTNASNQFGIYQAFNRKANHKYFISFEMHSFGTISMKRNKFSGGQDVLTDGLYQRIETATASGTLGSPYQLCYSEPVSDIANDYFTLKNFMIIDLTQMGLDSITSVEEFTSLFPLPYYSYNQGELISFNANAIKTVGFNQWDEEWESGRITADGTKSSASNYIRSANYIDILPNTAYYRKAPNNIQPFYYDADKNFISYGLWGANNIITTPSNAHYMLFHIDPAYGTTYKNDICINISDASRNGTYEPYQEHITNLPISTYFPTGMKSIIGTDVYDELTESKASARVFEVDMGTLAWQVDSYGNLVTTSVSDIPLGVANVKPNILCAKFETIIYANRGQYTTPVISVIDNYRDIQVRNSGYSDATAFTQAMSGVMLYYEPTAPAETSITTASLVSEYGEIPLKAEDDHLVAECTSELSSEAGFHDCKVKLMDEDGVVYSNRIQLHVERRP